MKNRYGKTPAYFTEFNTELGSIVLVKSRLGLCMLEFGSWLEQKAQIFSYCLRWMHTDELKENPAYFINEKMQITEYFAGKRNCFTLPIDVKGTLFQFRTWRILQEIPYGQTLAYSQVASIMHQPHAVRAVGQAIHRNPLPIVIPCHRVIGKQGDLVGYRDGLHRKQFLLELEKRILQLSVMNDDAMMREV